MKIRLIYLLYRLLLAVGSPIVLLYLAARSLRNPAYWGTLPERLGMLPSQLRQTLPGAVWLHAVSVGEVTSAAVLLEKLGAALPGVPVFVSVGTLAGRELAEKRLKHLCAGLFYAPLDYAWCVRRALRAIQPSLVVVLETEIWPNLWRETRRTGAHLVVLNARVSDRAYPRYRRLAWFFGPVLSHATAILTQTARDVDRYASLGRSAGVRDGGNLKYDVRPAGPSAEIADWIGGVRPGKIWIAASTMPPLGPGDIDEDPAVLDAFVELARAHPDLLLVHVPRRPERFDSAARELERRGIRHVRRSALPARLELPGALLLDTIGELAGLFRLADVVFMGGTLANRGGHNILEPALFGKPVVVGRNLQNFAEIAYDFRAAKALVEIADPAELASAVGALLADPKARREIGERAAELAVARTGAAGRAVAEIRHWHGRALVTPLLPLWKAAVLVPLSWLWRAGTAVDRRSSTAKKLATPVVSIGGIAMGGVGKTPFAIWLAGKLDNPAFLTRGYGRQSNQPLALPPGVSADVRATGDEGQLLARSGIGPVGVSANRHRAGVEIERRFHPAVFVLDDGFQHWRLHRDVDIVLIDALDPFGRGRVFPAGRLRESLAALRRADAFVVTRTVQDRDYTAIFDTLRLHNATAPVFLARTRPVGWTALDSGEHLPLQGAIIRVGAFCALGNPGGFFQTLSGAGVLATDLGRFPDHHRYSHTDLAQVRRRAREAGVPALATTEKDAANLPADWREHVRGIPIFALRIETEVDDEGLLLDFVRRRVSR